MYEVVDSVCSCSSFLLFCLCPLVQPKPATKVKARPSLPATIPQLVKRGWTGPALEFGKDHFIICTDIGMRTHAYMCTPPARPHQPSLSDSLLSSHQTNSDLSLMSIQPTTRLLFSQYPISCNRVPLFCSFRNKLILIAVTHNPQS